MSVHRAETFAHGWSLLIAQHGRQPVSNGSQTLRRRRPSHILTHQRLLRTVLSKQLLSDHRGERHSGDELGAISWKHVWPGKPFQCFQLHAARQTVMRLPVSVASTASRRKSMEPPSRYIAPPVISSTILVRMSTAELFGAANAGSQSSQGKRSIMMASLSTQASAVRYWCKLLSICLYAER